MTHFLKTLSSKTKQKKNKNTKRQSQLEWGASLTEKLRKSGDLTQVLIGT